MDRIEDQTRAAPIDEAVAIGFGKTSHA